MIEGSAHKTIVGTAFSKTHERRRFVAHTCLQLWSGNQQLMQSDPNICLGDYFEVYVTLCGTCYRGFVTIYVYPWWSICDKEWVEV